MASRINAQTPINMHALSVGCANKLQENEVNVECLQTTATLTGCHAIVIWVSRSDAVALLDPFPCLPSSSPALRTEGSDQALAGQEGPPEAQIQSREPNAGPPGPSLGSWGRVIGPQKLRL